jgi:two-component system CheB/CheR fusion protein
MPVAVTRCSADRRYVWVSQGCAAWLRRPAEDLVGRSIREVVGEAAYAVICPYIDRVLSGERVEYEASVTYSELGERWIKATYVPTFGESSAPNGWVAVISDLTEEKRREQALRTSEQLYRAIGESNKYGVWICDPQGRNIYASESLLRLVGMTQDECAEFGWTAALHPDDMEETLAAWRKCVEGGGTWDHEHRFRGVDGRWHPVLARGVPVRDERGKISAWAGINMDISRLKQVEHDLREADRRKDEFLAVLAHELRNPLAPICTGLELMRLSGNDPETIEEVRGMMERQSKQMVRLIDDLLDVSRITRGAIELRKCHVDLASVVQCAVETTRPIIAEYEHRLEVALPQEPIVLEADATRLAQVFANLLNNAAKFTKRGGAIRISAERQGAGVAVSVSDSGVGIPTDMMHRVFDMFTQLNCSADRSTGGLGIGLTLVKRLVEMHGGTVEVQSGGGGRGSTFVVRLPIALGSPIDVGPVNRDDRRPTMRRRILVVDDNESAAIALSMLLKALGHEVRTAFDGLSAIDVAAEFRPDVAILDIGMPRLDGYETAQRLREQAREKQLVLAALTGWGQDEDKRRSVAAGFDFHLVKPVEPAQLQQMLAECQLRVASGLLPA